MFDCLIDTCEQTTDLESVYNDKVTPSDAFDWAEVRAMREALAKVINENRNRYITWDKDNAESMADAYDKGLYTINHGKDLAYWTEVANAFSDMPYGYSLDLVTELFIEPKECDYISPT